MPPEAPVTSAIGRPLVLWTVFMHPSSQAAPDRPASIAVYAMMVIGAGSAPCLVDRLR